MARQSRPLPNSIGGRLCEERQRLSKSQKSFAALADASVRAQIKWEQDQSSPTAKTLAAFAGAGADILYIVTGVRAMQPVSALAHSDDSIALIARHMLAAMPPAERRQLLLALI